MRKNKSILLVEDDPNDIELTLIALSEYNLVDEVEIVRDGVEAIDFLYRRNNYSSRADGNPIVIMLDLKLPKMDGIEVLKIIKSDVNMKSIPVVIVTSSRENKDIEVSYKFGVNSYVVKPVKFTAFVKAVKRIGVFWTLINEAPPGSINRINPNLHF